MVRVLSSVYGSLLVTQSLLLDHNGVPFNGRGDGISTVPLINGGSGGISSPFNPDSSVSPSNASPLDLFAALFAARDDSTDSLRSFHSAIKFCVVCHASKHNNSNPGLFLKRFPDFT